MIFDIFSSSIPLILCSIAALFSEFSGSLALFIDGLLSFSGFLTYLFTILTKSIFLGTLISSTICVSLIFGFSVLIQKFKAKSFISAFSLNLLFSSLVSCLSFFVFGTRGVLISSDFSFKIFNVKMYELILGIILILLSILFLLRTKIGLRLRFCQSDSEVLSSVGVSVNSLVTLSWCLAGFFTCISGSFLTMRISSFVPNIAGGRGWMALASVFVAKKKISKMIIAVLVFCLADFITMNIINIFPQIPSSVLLSFPYFMIFLLVLVKSK